jgi:hypothetical protein
LPSRASRLGGDESDPSSEDKIYPEPEEPEDLVQGSNTGFVHFNIESSLILYLASSFVERGKPDKEAASAHAPVKKSDKGKDKDKDKDKDKNKKDPPPSCVRNILKQSTAK